MSIAQWMFMELSGVIAGWVIGWFLYDLVVLLKGKKHAK